MMPKIDQSELWEAANHLSKTDKGRESMRLMLEWFEELGGLSLDYTNQRAVLKLIEGAWGSYAGTARDAMHRALGD